MKYIKYELSNNTNTIKVEEGIRFFEDSASEEEIDEYFSTELKNKIDSMNNPNLSYTHSEVTKEDYEEFCSSRGINIS